eukprot:4707473-Pleurochrysis_carterae.AAC.2
MHTLSIWYCTGVAGNYREVALDGSALLDWSRSDLHAVPSHRMPRPRRNHRIAAHARQQGQQARTTGSAARATWSRTEPQAREALS